MEEQKAKFELIDVEGYRSEQDQAFSHQILVMKAMKKCIDLGSKELIEGFYDETQKDRSGSIKVVYKEDTRKAFIESVKTLKMIMICDFDSEAKNNVKKLYEKRAELRRTILENQKEWYYHLPLQIRKDNPKSEFDLKYFNCNDQYLQFFWNNFIDEELEIYREICEELTLLTKRMHYYQNEDLEV